jgi:hypothetical protein
MPNCVVDPGFAVHPHHADVERMAGRERAQPEECQCDRRVDVFREPAHLGNRAAVQHPLPRQDYRLLRRLDQIDRPGKLAARDRQLRAIAAQLDRRCVPLPVHLCLLRVLGDVNEYRPGTSRLGQVKRFLHRGHDVFDARHQVAVLRDRQRDTGDVRFLKRVVANQLARHLPGDADHRHRVHHRGRNPGDQICRARPRSCDRDADTAARARVAIRHVRRALFVPHEDMPDRVIEHRVVGRKDRAARIPENRVYSLMDKAFPDDLRTGTLGWHAAQCALPGLYQSN